MAVLSEDKSQMWILGVSYLPHSYSRLLDPPPWCYPDVATSLFPLDAPLYGCYIL